MTKNAEFNEICKAFLKTNVFPLLSLPAGDGNYESALLRATQEELATAVALMENYPEGNLSRINACKKALNI